MLRRFQVQDARQLGLGSHKSWDLSFPKKQNPSLSLTIMRGIKVSKISEIGRIYNK